MILPQERTAAVLNETPRGRDYNPLLIRTEQALAENLQSSQVHLTRVQGSCMNARDALQLLCVMFLAERDNNKKGAAF